MKTFRSPWALGALAVFFVGGLSFHVASQPTNVARITLALMGTTDGGSEEIPAVVGAHAEGGASTASDVHGMRYECRTGYRITLANKDQLAVRVHYVIQWPDRKEPVIVDRTLPVGSPATYPAGLVPPRGTVAVKVDRYLTAFAYFTQN